MEDPARRFERHVGCAGEHHLWTSARDAVRRKVEGKHVTAHRHARHTADRYGRAGRIALVYRWCMARTNIDIDEDACRTVMDRYHLRSKREAVNYALRLVAGEVLDIDDARSLRGSGWEGDLNEMRRVRPA